MEYIPEAVDEEAKETGDTAQGQSVQTEGGTAVGSKCSGALGVNVPGRRELVYLDA